MTPELELALVTFAAVVAAQLGKAALRMLQSFVKGTKTNLDDKVLAAVTKALKQTHVVRLVDKKLDHMGKGGTKYKESHSPESWNT